jgi:predicted DNA-binding antitoxin AbrB/MazE fold protein
MTKNLDAFYDGEVLRLSQPINLRPNTRVRITLETNDQEEMKSSSFLRTARLLNIEGPLDWSERLEDYLYSGDDRAKQ